jgi:outer membrane receptor protein involved in Fe transport
MNPTAGQSSGWAVFPSSYSSLIAGIADDAEVSARVPFSVKIRNYSLFARDTWRASDRLTLTYGMRWEINTPPASAIPGKPLYAVLGIFDSNPLAVAPGPLWHTRFGNFAPRFGAAYHATPKTVIRGGVGIFYDLGYGNVGDTSGEFPYQRSSFLSSSTLPFNLSNAAFQPPTFSTKIDSNVLYMTAVDPLLQLPFTIEWNAAIERALGVKQTLTATYVGSDGRRLLRDDLIVPPEFVGFGTGGQVFARGLLSLQCAAGAT